MLLSFLQKRFTHLIEVALPEHVPQVLSEDLHSGELGFGAQRLRQKVAVQRGTE